MQISYHSAFAKIQKLQNWKKKYFSIDRYTRYRPKHSKLASTASTRPIFKPVRNVDILVQVHVLVWYILSIPIDMVRYQPP